MSITYTADVFCEGCGKWEYGECASLPPPKDLAREKAHKCGWITIRGKDYCPECQAIGMDKAPTPAQLRMLGDIAYHNNPYFSVCGHSAHGGAWGTITALYRRGWITKANAITDAGRAVLTAYKR